MSAQIYINICYGYRNDSHRVWIIYERYTSMVLSAVDCRIAQKHQEADKSIPSISIAHFCQSLFNSLKRWKQKTRFTSYYAIGKWLFQVFGGRIPHCVWVSTFFRSKWQKGLNQKYSHRLKRKSPRIALGAIWLGHIAFCHHTKPMKSASGLQTFPRNIKWHFCLQPLQHLH